MLMLLSFLDELKKINKNKDVALTVQLTGNFIDQVHETQTNQVNDFETLTKMIIDFIILQLSTQMGNGKQMVPLSVLEDKWEELKVEFKSIKNKTPEVRDSWKQISVIISRYFIKRKLKTNFDLSVNVSSAA